MERIKYCADLAAYERDRMARDRLARMGLFKHVYEEGFEELRRIQIKLWESGCPVTVPPPSGSASEEGGQSPGHCLDGDSDAESEVFSSDDDKDAEIVGYPSGDGESVVPDTNVDRDNWTWEYQGVDQRWDGDGHCLTDEDTETVGNASGDDDTRYRDDSHYQSDEDAESVQQTAVTPAQSVTQQVIDTPAQSVAQDCVTIAQCVTQLIIDSDSEGDIEVWESPPQATTDTQHAARVKEEAQPLQSARVLFATPNEIESAEQQLFAGDAKAARQQKDRKRATRPAWSKEVQQLMQVGVLNTKRQRKHVIKD